MKFNGVTSSFNSLDMYPVCWDRDRCDIMSTNCYSKATGFQITSQFVPRDRCYFMSTNCCSVRKRQDPKSDRCSDQGIVAFVLKTKLDAMHDDFIVDDRRQQDSKFD